MEISGFLAYFIFFLTFVGIYGVLILGLNLQWGFTGQVNFGVAAFFMVGAYAMAIATTAPTDDHLGGFGLPFVVGLIIAMIISGALAFLVGIVTLRLRADYLAIATIGIAEIVRQFLKNEDWLTNGVRGIVDIRKPYEGELGGAEPLVYLAIVAVAVAIVFFALERLRKSPFGRVLRALRENEDTARASGKSIVSFQLQVFVLGSSIMGLAGGLYASFFSFISPEAFTNTIANFLPWVMLIAGGSGNNYGTMLGAFVIWVVWTVTDYVINQVIPADMVTKAGALRLLLIGVLLQVILLFRPKGLLPEGFRLKFMRKE
ncbi:MAG: branched-chain amino acid ABC transporter permease [Alphaproteobacteria bacterium]|nr:branched-chain amino acid ABC transporter permease [Alphaproteobacteria bacterium]